MENIKDFNNGNNKTPFKHTQTKFIHQENLIGAIAQNIQNKLGLVNFQIKE